MRDRFMLEKLVIREETPADYYDAELVAKRAFWNLHVPGCNEHYLVHLLRDDPAYIPALSRVAEVDGELVAAIYYAAARVEDGEQVTPVLTFGPLCVDPAYQRKGIGGALLAHTISLARQAGHKAIVIYGEPEYYPRFGFRPCEAFGITTPQGRNFPAFMGVELRPGGLEGVRGKFHEAEVYSNLPAEETDEYDAKFPHMPKLKLPGQWNN
ncbi:MAG TPA: N-acetyltransferase [Clostridia bacterium]|nr:N-acetyltransferase [Clostridia bacterium]